jgi:ribosomal protein L6P/L9E
MSTRKSEMIEIEIPQGITVEVNGTEIETKGSLGTNKRTFNDALYSMSRKHDKIIDSIR